MKRVILRTAAVTAAMAALAASASAQVVGIATNPQGTLGYLTGIAVAKVVTAKSGGITARAQPMGGSTTYVPMVNRGEIAFGFTNGGELQHAFNGVGTFDGKKQSDLRVVAHMFPLRSGIAVVADSGMTKISDLKKNKGKRVTAEYTSLAILEDFIAAGLANGGVSYADFTKVPVSGLAKGIAALGEGKADVAWVPVGSGGARKIHVQLQSRGGMRYLDLDTSPEALARFKKLAPALEIVKEVNTKMPGVPEPTHVAQMAYIMVTGKKTPDDVVYKITKTVIEQQEELQKALGAFRRNKKDEMGLIDLAPYHPGAIKAFKEAGMKIKG